MEQLQDTIILDGRKTSESIMDEIAVEVKQMKQEEGRVPYLGAILVGEDGASQTYVRNKIKACKRVGFKSKFIHLDKEVSEEELIEEIHRMNNDSEINGFIVQLPLPDHISDQKVTQAIRHDKDVDGFTVENFGRMASLLPAYWPATPLGVIELLKRYDIETKGKHVVVVGQSRHVGAPLSMLLTGPGKATVTSCHIHTQDLAFYTRMADILIVAVGKPGLISGDMVKEGVVVVDIGINRVADETAKRGYVLRGDVEFEQVSEKSSFITPVPGGVGPMTIASLLINTLYAAKGTIYK